MGGIVIRIFDRRLKWRRFMEAWREDLAIFQERGHKIGVRNRDAE